MLQWKETIPSPSSNLLVLESGRHGLGEGQYTGKSSDNYRENVIEKMESNFSLDGGKYPRRGKKRYQSDLPKQVAGRDLPHKLPTRNDHTEEGQALSPPLQALPSEAFLPEPGKEGDGQPSQAASWCSHRQLSSHGPPHCLGSQTTTPATWLLPDNHTRSCPDPEFHPTFCDLCTNTSKQFLPTPF